MGLGPSPAAMGNTEVAPFEPKEYVPAIDRPALTA